MSECPYYKSCDEGHDCLYGVHNDVMHHLCVSYQERRAAAAEAKLTRVAGLVTWWEQRLRDLHSEPSVSAEQVLYLRTAYVICLRELDAALKEGE